eukprot:4195184-Prymnesium_polylepis.1
MERSSEYLGTGGLTVYFLNRVRGITLRQLPRMATGILTGIILLILTGFPPKFSWGISQFITGISREYLRISEFLTGIIAGIMTRISELHRQKRFQSRSGSRLGRLGLSAHKILGPRTLWAVPKYSAISRHLDGLIP